MIDRRRARVPLAARRAIVHASRCGFPSPSIIRRTPLVQNRWVSERWEPVARRARRRRRGTPPTQHVVKRIDAAGVLDAGASPGMLIELHPTEAEGYYLNLDVARSEGLRDVARCAKAAASRRSFPVIVTVSYNEAARMLDGGEQVDCGAARRADPRAGWSRSSPSTTSRSRRKKVRRNDPFAEATRVRDRDAQRRARPQYGDRDGRRTDAASASRSSAGRGSSTRPRARRPKPRRAARAPAPARRPPSPAARRGGRTAVRARRRRRAAAAGRVADDRFRFHARSCKPKVDEALQAAGAEEAVPRSALQRDGRPRHLHRRLLAARSDRAGDRAQMAQARATSSIRRRRASTRRASSRTCPPEEAATTPKRRRRSAGRRRCRRRRRRRCPSRSAAPSAPAPSGARIAEPIAASSRRDDAIEPQADEPPPTSSCILCSCNGTMPLDAGALARALELAGAPPVRTMLCQKELAAFADGAQGDVVVACTQEARLFGEVAEEGGETQTIRFVNIRETGGWSAEARGATPKIAALLAAGRRCPSPRRCRASRYQSEGQLLIVGPARRRAAAGPKRCRAQLGVTVLVTGRTAGAELPAERAIPDRIPGSSRKLSGWLGAFEVAWAQENPIDLDLCTRCNACMRACPEQAIDFELPDRPRPLQATPQVRRRVRRDRRDRLRAQRHRARASASISCSTCSATPSLRDAPAAAGLLRARAPTPWRRRKAVAELATMTGEFEKPKYFAYKASICAHSRSQQDRLQPVHRRLLDARRSAPTATTSRSSRTFAWAAARARPCARRAR